MLQQVLAYALPVLGWWMLTGIINLAFAYKSQIEAWAEANPRLASLLKFTRALGFDPWNLLSSLKLFAQKKLPDAQKSDSPIAKLEQRKADAKALGIDPKDPPGGAAGGGFPGDERTPPSLPGVHPYRFAVLALLVLGCGPALSTKRCDFQNPAYSLEVTRCRQRIESTCLLNPDGTPVKSCPALVECEAWRKRECQ